MRRISSLITAACAMLLVGLVAGMGSPAPLPKNFVGRWSAVPQVTPIGPLNAPLNLSIMSLPGSNDATWLMYREFDTVTIHNSKQQFWVNSFFLNGNSGPVSSTLVYCGLLLGFYDEFKPYNSLPIEVALQEVARNDTFLAWNFTAPANGPQGAPLQGQWTMQLSDDNDQLTSIFMLPAGDATHVDVTFNRMTDLPTFVPEIPAEMSFPYQPPCYNMTAPLSKCPLGFTHGKPPKHVQALIDKQKSEGIVAAPKATEKPKKPSYLGYDHCYVLNDAMNFTVRWSMDQKASEASVLFSGTTFDDTSYVALGILPNWPLMQNMDVIMGYIGAVSGEACLRNMFAEYTFGTPVDQTNQTLADTKVWKENQTVYVSFKRPFSTGHHDLMNPFVSLAQDVTPVVAFAFGRAADNCTSRPHYHYGSRGVFGFDWKSPEAAISDLLKCK